MGSSPVGLKAANPAFVLSDSSDAKSCVWLDHDNDGRLDLLTAGRSGGLIVEAPIRLYRNDPTNGFVLVDAGFSGTAQTLAVADFDNDGLMDVVSAKLYEAAVWRNQGNGRFEGQLLAAGGDYLAKAEVADLDRDGRVDILLGGILHLNLGGFQFTNSFAGMPTTSAASTVVGDYDRDGWPDILLCGQFGDDVGSRLYRNLGGGQFSRVGGPFPKFYWGEGAWLDYDGDGHLDVLVSGYDGAMGSQPVLLHALGDGSFTNMDPGLPATGMSLMATADANNDGVPDLLLSWTRLAWPEADQPDSRLYLGRPDGRFAEKLGFGPTNVTASPAWGDYDRDGRIDLGMVHVQEDLSLRWAVYRNELTATNRRPTAPSVFSARTAPRRVLLEWSPGDDNETPVPTLTYSIRVGTAPGVGDIVAPDALPTGLRTVARHGNAGPMTFSILTNLDFGRYYWSVQTVDGAFEGSDFSPEQTIGFHVATLPAESVAAVGATLRGIVDTNALPGALYFEWGSEGDLSESIQASVQQDAADAWFAVLAGLDPGVRYEARLVLSNAVGIYRSGSESFVTIGYPVIAESSATTLSANRARLNATISPERGTTSVFFEFGQSIDFGDLVVGGQIGADSSPAPVSLSLSNLIAGTTYYYRVGATNVAGVRYGPIQSFTTTTEPTVATEPADPISVNGATLHATVNPNGHPTRVAFHLGENQLGEVPGLATNLPASAEPVSVALHASGLEPGVGYTFRVVATNVSGVSTGAVLSFRTAPPYELATNVLAGGIGGSTTILDLNRDGKLDLHLMGLEQSFGSSAKSWVYLGDGQGGFTAFASGLPGVANGRAAWADMDNDGWLDVVIAGMAGASPSSRIFRNRGDGTFTNLNVNLTPVSNPALAWGDYDNDGLVDLLLAGTTTGGGLVAHLFRNDGNGAFSAVPTSFPGVSRGSIGWCDFDGDAWLDVFIAGSTTSSTSVARLFRNNRNGTFMDTGLAFKAGGNGSVSWGDYNRDGRPDLLVLGATNQFTTGLFSQVYRNDGEGRFAAIAADLRTSAGGSGIWGDYDGDGDLDILVTGPGSSAAVMTTIYRNLGNDTFALGATNAPGVTSASAAWGDLNGDGRLDQLVSGSRGVNGQAFVYWNRLPGTNSLPPAPTGLRAVRSASGVELSWSPGTGLEGLSSSVTYNVRIGTRPGSGDVRAADSSTNGVRWMAVAGNAGVSSRAVLGNSDDTLLYWSVQAVDGAFLGSGFAPEQTLLIPKFQAGAGSEPGSSFRFQFQAEPGYLYDVLRSTNLIDWNLLGPASQISSNVFEFDRIPQPGESREFFKIQMR